MARNQGNSAQDMDKEFMTRAPVWGHDENFNHWRRSLELWTLSTGIPANRLAAHCAQACFRRGSDREALAQSWCPNNKDKAASPDGLEQLVRYMQKKSEGEARDVRLDQLYGFLRLRRGIEEEVWEKKRTGGEVIHEEHVRQTFVEPINGDWGPVVEMPNRAREGQQVMLNVTATLLLHSCRLTVQDEKMILDKIPDEEFDPGRVEAAIRRLYPLKTANRIPEGTRKRFGARAKAAFLGLPDPEGLAEGSAFVANAESEGESEEDVDLQWEEDSQADVGEMEQTPEAFMAFCDCYVGKDGGFMVRKKKGFGPFPSRKGGKSKGSGKGTKRKNAIDPLTGQPTKCYSCGSDEHYSGTCPLKKQQDVNRKKNQKRSAKKEAARLAAECETPGQE